MENREEKKLGGDKSALSVNAGVKKPPMINEAALARIRATRRKQLTVDEYVDGILSGNRTVLSQAITLVESLRPEHYALSQEIIARCLPHSGKSYRIGVTGVPGAGKSTVIEELGCILTGQGHRLAVLAIDPSSAVTKGSILGDKTRMEKLSVDPNAFIRPSPSAGSLGGVARKTRETIVLCEAAGFDIVFIETVGVGQSETAVHSMVDMFLLILISGAGDELQGIKRGIMEMADVLAINKADGQNIKKALMAKAQYQSALRLFPMSQSGWAPVATTCSAYTRDGLFELWDTVEEFFKQIKENGYFNRHRQEQSQYWMRETINDELLRSFYEDEKVMHAAKTLEESVRQGQVSPFVAAQELLDLFFNELRESK